MPVRLRFVARLAIPSLGDVLSQGLATNVIAATASSSSSSSYELPRRRRYLFYVRTTLSSSLPLLRIDYLPIILRTNRLDSFESSIQIDAKQF